MAKKRSLYSIQEAMDSLAAVVQLDLSAPTLLGIMNGRLVTDAEAVGSQEIVWLSGEGSEVVCEILDRVFHTVQNHLRKMLQDSEVNWEDPSVVKGAKTMVELSSEAAHKMGLYLKERLGKEIKIEDRSAYRELQNFYREEWVKKVEGSEEDWNQATVPLHTGLFDFETVKRDESYELFSLSDEEGNPYFNDELLKNIKLACFEEGEGQLEEDPLLSIRAIEDRNLGASAQQILNSCDSLIDDYYAMTKKSETTVVREMNMALMALYLAANPRNLLQYAAEKSCFSYFQDFHLFLRKAMNSDEYQHYIAYPPDKEDKMGRLLLAMVHALSRALFYRTSGVKQEVIGFIHRCMRKGETKLAKKGNGFWDQLLIDDEHLRDTLRQVPNGALFKILDVIRQERLELLGFDTFLQGNLPQMVGQIRLFGTSIDVLRFGCPTRQLLIHRTTPIEEFRGFLRCNAAEKKPKKHLLFNLQNRMSWQESARCHTIEDLQNNAEFREVLSVVTLTKDGEFYHQNGEYINCSDAEEFIERFKAQLEYPESCGFFFPAHRSLSILNHWFDDAFRCVHQLFFQEKVRLTRQEREEFIELFYQLLILKFIELFEPDSISFSCKDAVDTGAAQLALFYGFLMLQREGTVSKEEGDFLRYLFYAPALFVRERAIHSERFIRAVATLRRAEDGKSQIKALSQLYKNAL
jgi:hypothetical protein